MDHRGVGKSSKIKGKKEASECLSDLDRCVSLAKTPIRVITPANAAMDLIVLTKEIKNDVGENSEFFAISHSYGTHLVYRALAKDPKLVLEKTVKRIITNFILVYWSSPSRFYALIQRWSSQHWKIHSRKLS